MGLSSHPNTTDSIRSHRPTSVGFLFENIKIFPDIMELRLCANIDLNYP